MSRGLGDVYKRQKQRDYGIIAEIAGVVKIIEIVEITEIERQRNLV